MTQLKEGGCQPRDWEEHLSSASTVIARWQGMAGTSRVNREVYARFCGRLEVKSLRPTRQSASQAQRFLSAHAMLCVLRMTAPVDPTIHRRRYDGRFRVEIGRLPTSDCILPAAAILDSDVAKV